MAKLSEILQERFRKKEKPKMSELVEKSTDGQLTPFSAVFRVPRVDDQARKQLADLLSKYVPDEQIDISSDLNTLLAITTEVKAITNQAALLHGERIKKAQDILKSYREGAFTAWLTATYGNRQTPYNFLQYYEFYLKMPQTLHRQIEVMPRQAVYTLASREGEFAKKEEIVKNYNGETKQEMIFLIRTLFPLKDKDRRRENIFHNALKQLKQIEESLKKAEPKLSTKQKQELFAQLEALMYLLN